MRVETKAHRWWLLSFLFVLLSLTGILRAEWKPDPKLVKLGKRVYMSRCVICHGEKGDGKGLIGVIHRVEKNGLVWTIYPRDFTSGVFKFRSTPSGCLPTDADLMRTVRNGIPRSGMPSHADLSKKEIRAVVEYIKTFSERWEEEEPCEPVKVKMPKWVGCPESVAKGKKIYKRMKCWECHGMEGKGDGPKADQLKDDWGDKIVPFDFTTGALKMGFQPDRLYLAFTTGLDGSGMPSFQDSLTDEERWHLVSYALKLMNRLKDIKKYGGGVCK